MNVMELEKHVIMQTYARYDLVLVRGQGCRIWDDHGREYIDFMSGIAVCNLGHSHPRVTEAVCRQAETLMHTSNLYYTEPQVRLAEALTNHSFADKAFFCNSGAEANEAAIKLARKYAAEIHGPLCHRIITTEMSFHGRTMATLTATGQAKVKKGFDPLLEGFVRVPFNNLEAAERAMDETVCAFFVEPIQGEGGVNVPAEGYLKGLRELCDQRGILLMLDEVQTGMGRTGTLFAHQRYGVEPHVMTLAKALANGLPMGAMLALDRVAEHFGPGSHATTFGGNPVCAAAATAVMEILTEPGFLEDVRRRETLLKQRLEEIARASSGVRRLRGSGMMWALDVEGDARSLVRAAQTEGVLLNAVQDKTVRLIPPLIVSDDEIRTAAEVLQGVLGRSL